MAVLAQDADAKDESGMGYGDVGYFLDSEYFRIDQRSGKIFVKKTGLDREQSTEYQVTVSTFHIRLILNLHKIAFRI